MMTYLTTADGGQGSYWEVIGDPTAIPGTEGLQAPAPIATTDDRIFWIAPDASGGNTLASIDFQGYYITGELTFGTPSSVPAVAGEIDELTTLERGTTRIAAYRTTAADGTRSIVVRRGTQPADAASPPVWGTEQTVCHASDTGAAQGCSEVRLVTAADGSAHVLYRETPPGQATELRQRTVLPQLTAPRTLGAVATPYDLVMTKIVWKGHRFVPQNPVVVGADASGVRVWRMNSTGDFYSPTLVSGGPASNASIADTGGGVTVSWTSGTDLWVARLKDGVWSKRPVTTIAGTVIASGVADADAPPTAWYVADTGAGHVLRTTTLDEVGPKTIWHSLRQLRRAGKRTSRLRATYDSRDYSGVRTGIIQVRVGRSKGHMGAWHRLEKHIFSRQPVTASRTVKFRAKPGLRYCVRARTTDSVGNVGRWGSKNWFGPEDRARCLTVKR